ncbi:hypothetical protein [Streptomyces zaomyceticus]|uniref:hypothetical protein n=1 Tax=Streptomyces zaomyceticus TaxID=68286 RepID=UPI003674CB43
MPKVMNPRIQPVAVEPEVLAANLSLYDLGLYVKVNEWLPLLVEGVSVDDLLLQMRSGRFGEENSEADLRAGIQRLADAGLIDLDDEDDQDGPLAHLVADRIRELPPYSPPHP